MSVTTGTERRNQERGCIGLPPETWCWIRQRKEKVGVPISETVRRALTAYRQQLEDDEQEE